MKKETFVAGTGMLLVYIVMLVVAAWMLILGFGAIGWTSVGFLPMIAILYGIRLALSSFNFNNPNK